MPDSVESVYSDIAVIFHWQPSEMDKMNIDELMNFRKMAADRRE